MNNTERRKVLKWGRDDLFQMFTATHTTTFRTAGVPHGHLGGETSFQRLVRKPFNCHRLRFEVRVDMLTDMRSNAKRDQRFTHMPSERSWSGTIAQRLVILSHKAFVHEKGMLDFNGETHYIDRKTAKKQP